MTASSRPAPLDSASWLSLWESLAVFGVRWSAKASNASRKLSRDFLEKVPRYPGAWPHFLNGYTAQSMLIFGMFDNGGDLVETLATYNGRLVGRPPILQGSQCR